MAFPRGFLCRASSSFRTSSSFLSPPTPFSLFSPTSSFGTLSLFASLCVSAQCHYSSQSVSSSLPQTNSDTGWKPMCLYYTQGKCTKMDDSLHLDRFSHDCSRDLDVNDSDFANKCSQELDYFLVLDLEGKVEILEFPVLTIDAKSMAVVNFFHRFVRPSEMSEQAINRYIEGKYGKFGVDRVWHDTAIPFAEVLLQFETWLTWHDLWEKKRGGQLNHAAFVTCGDWDIKTKIPQQCRVSRIKLPQYFMEWINLKDVYNNFYGSKITGMMGMLKERHIRSLGSHHLGIDDTKNIARVLQRMLADGALLQVTARRNPDCQSVQFFYKDHIR